MEKHVNKFVTVWALALTAFLVMGLTIPNSFTAGSTISSADMNANFAAVKAAVDALEAQSASAGNIRGFAYINADGTVATSWQANGMTPTVAHVAASNVYDVTFPGEAVSTDSTNRCVLANVRWTSAGYVVVSGLAPAARLRVFDGSGAGVERDLWVMITGAP